MAKAKTATKKTSKVPPKKQSPTVNDYPDHAPIFVAADNVGTWRDYEHYVTHIDDYAKELGISIEEVKQALSEGHINLNGSYDANLYLANYDTLKNYRNKCQRYFPESEEEIAQIFDKDYTVFVESGYIPIEISDALAGSSHTELLEKIMDEGLITSKWRETLDDISYRMMWDEGYKWPYMSKIHEGYFGDFGTVPVWKDTPKNGTDGFDIRKYMDRVLYEKHGGIVFLKCYFDSPHYETKTKIQYCEFPSMYYVLVPELVNNWGDIDVCSKLHSPPGVEITEEECAKMMKEKFAGAKELHLKNVTMKTPDGLYYSPHRIVGYKKKKKRSLLSFLFGKSVKQ